MSEICVPAGAGEAEFTEKRSRFLGHVRPVNSEEEALDLENSLIKEFQPRYNVLLKDDKSYPWICVTKELFPRVFITREKHTRGAKYFGPYPKTEVAHALVDTLKQLYLVGILSTRKMCQHKNINSACNTTSRIAKVAARDLFHMKHIVPTLPTL